VCYSVENGGTAVWDPIFGRRWDVVARKAYVVTTITFKKATFRAPFRGLLKLRCRVTTMHYPNNQGDGYRAAVATRILERNANLRNLSAANNQIPNPSAAADAAEVDDTHTHDPAAPPAAGSAPIQFPNPFAHYALVTSPMIPDYDESDEEYNCGSKTFFVCNLILF
jgi:hypothetical protein